MIPIFDYERSDDIRKIAQPASLLYGGLVVGIRLALNLACSIEVACSHVSGLWMQPKPTAGPDGVREPRPRHSNGINVPTKRQASLGCVGSTDCAITRCVTLPPGRARLATKPAPTGSTTFAKTIGSVRVASSNGRMVENPLVKITSGPRSTISAATLRARPTSLGVSLDTRG